MNRILTIIPAALLLMGCGRTAFYVDPNGDDAGNGSIGQPFRTVERAMRAVRELPDRKVDARVIFRGGKYLLDHTVRFTVEDSAPEGHRYSYEAYPGETPVFTSAFQLKDWKKSETYPAEVADSVMAELYETGFPAELSAPKVLFTEDKMIFRSRKGGFHIKPMKPAPEGGAVEKGHYRAARSMNVYAPEDRYLLKEFEYEDVQGILRDWSSEDEVEVAFAPVPWALNILPIERVDRSRHKVHTSIEANSPAGAKASHTAPWVENAPEYIAPGTFVTRGHKIWYCRKDGERPEDLAMPAMIEYFLVEGDIDKAGEDVPVRNLTFKGLTFTQADRYSWREDHKGRGIQHDWDKWDEPNAMLRLRGAENCTVEACRFTNSGSSAIRMDLYCQRNTVKNCLIDHVGHMGVLLCGYGPGNKDVNKHNIVTNNIIHHVGQVITHGAGVLVWQSGENLISHNLIHHVPRKGVGICGVRMPILAKEWCDFDEASKTVRWEDLDEEARSRWKEGGMTLGQYWKTCLRYLHARNNRVEFNEIHHALEKLADGSVLNVSGAGTGNVVASNYVHHILSHASAALRTDDWQCGTVFEKNIVWKSNIAGTVHKGHNGIYNNIYIDCNPKAYLRFASWPDEEADYGSGIRRNVFYETGGENENGGKTAFYGIGYRVSEGISKPEDCDIDCNLFWSDQDREAPERHLRRYQALGIDGKSVIADPMIRFQTNPTVVPFLIGKDSPVWKLGFRKIDFDRIGLIRKDYPASLLEYGETDAAEEEGPIRSRKSLDASYEFM